MIEFRKAEKQDWPAIEKVVFSVLEEYGLKPDPQKTDADLRDLDACYFSNGGYFEVCERDGRIVGTWGLVPLNEKTCELRKMYLMPQQRGRGIGSTMLERAIEKARELGFTHVELATASVLKEAISLYKKFGFKPAAGRQFASRCDQALELELGNE